MTPAINCLVKHRIAHQVHHYQHQPGAASYGREAADKLGLDPARVFKTLVIQLDGKSLAVAILPVAHQLSLKKVASAFGAKKAAMADKSAVQRSTGYVLGGVSPIGQKKALKTLVDDSARTLSTCFISAGKRGLEIELTPTDLIRVVRGDFAAICQ